MNRANLLLIILVLIGNASAWGSLTHKYFCEEAVKRVWDQGALDCLNVSRRNFCNVLENKQREECMKNPVAVWDIPEFIFKDEDLHYDYSRCPIMGHDGEWICGNPIDRFASDTADVWFEKAKVSKDICTRVYEFCIGSHYFADSYFSLHQTKYSSPKCMGDLEIEVDSNIYYKNWTVKKHCWFSHSVWKGGINRTVNHHQFFIVTDRIIENVLRNLTLMGETIEAIPLISTTTTTLKGPDIALVVFMEENVTNFTVVYENASEEVNETITELVGLLDDITKPPKKRPKEPGEMKHMWWFLGFIFMFGITVVLYVFVTVEVKKKKAEVVKPTSLRKLKGINEEIEDKLLKCDIYTIPRLMKTNSKKLAKWISVSEKKIEGWKRAQLKMADNYFRLRSPLTHDDLTKEQLEEIMEMKIKINGIMQQYRDEEKLTESQKKDFEKIVGPLDPDEKTEAMKIIKGEVNINEDYPYRILVTSAEIESKLAEIRKQGL